MREKSNGVHAEHTVANRNTLNNVSYNHLCNMEG